MGDVPSGLVAATHETSKVVALEASVTAVTVVARPGVPALIAAEATEATEVPVALVPVTVKV